jgi:hypothetical protein
MIMPANLDLEQRTITTPHTDGKTNFQHAWNDEADRISLCILHETWKFIAIQTLVISKSEMVRVHVSTAQELITPFITAKPFHLVSVTRKQHLHLLTSVILKRHQSTLSICRSLNLLHFTSVKTPVLQTTKQIVIMITFAQSRHENCRTHHPIHFAVNVNYCIQSTATEQWTCIVLGTASKRQ